MSSRHDFAGKRIAVVGLGHHGEMMADVAYLVGANALVSVYDIRPEARIQSMTAYVRGLGLANLMCGSVPADDLGDMDMIVLSHEYAKNSSFLVDARKRGVPIERPETVLLRSMPPVSVVAVMGSCGKSTVASMLAPMIEAACAEEKSQSCFSVDPESSDGVIACLKRMRSGDIVVMRLPPSMMTEIHSLGWSPHVAVFTTMPPEGSYRSSPFEILEHQTYNNSIVASDAIIDAIKASGLKPKAKMLRTKASMLPEGWLSKGRGEHDKENASLALQAARIFKVTDGEAERALSKWRPLKGRLEPLKKVRGVGFFNDAASVSPHATIAAMSSIAGDRDLVVIIGGAEAGEDYRSLYAALPKYAHTLVTVPGSGTLRERWAMRGLDGMEVLSAPSLEEAVRQAMDHAKKGDKVLFSPGFAAAGVDPSRMERGERFARAVRAL